MATKACVDITTEDRRAHVLFIQQLFRYIMAMYVHLYKDINETIYIRIERCFRIIEAILTVLH